MLKMKISWDMKGKVLTLAVGMYNYAALTSNFVYLCGFGRAPKYKLSSEVRKTSSLEK
jgi:hypothetical protein